ncbi:MAG: class I SAM-dependent methyltransferase [Sulfuricaulis sp.]
MSAQKTQHEVAQVFNQVAAGYDHAALRFFPFAADRLIMHLHPVSGTKILDLAAGTGAVTLAAARAVGPQGRVSAVDLAENMLDRLQEKIVKFGIRHVDLHTMDAAALDFRRDYFDYTVCSFGIFFLPDMVAGLREWARVTRPGGRLMFTAFAESAFQPMMDLFLRRLERYGIRSPDPDKPPAGMRLADPARCRELLDAAGLVNIDVTTEQLGYHLKDESEWWDVLWNSGTRGWIEKVPRAELESFRAAHLAEVRPLCNGQGLRLDIATHFAGGDKPPAPSSR